MALTRENIPDFAKLSNDQILEVAGFLEALTAHPSFEVWQKMLESFRQGALEQLSEADDPRELHFWQGVVHACKVIRDRPNRLISDAKELKAEEEREQAAQAAETRRYLGLAPGLSVENDMSDMG